MPVRQMNSKNFATVLAAMLLSSACGDNSSTGPIEGTFTLHPRTQWSGELVEATWSGFAAADTWVVLLDGDTASSWRTDAATIAFELPNPHLTGTAVVDIKVPGAALHPSTVDVVGNAWPGVWLGCTEPELCSVPVLEGGEYDYHGMPLPSGQILAFFQAAGGTGPSMGFGMANLAGPDPVVTWIPQLAAPDLPGLVAPGRTADANHWIFDTSPAAVAQQPQVWNLGQLGSPVRPLACLADGIANGYAVVELPSGDCLVLANPGRRQTGSLMVNAVSPIIGYASIPWGWTAGCAGFRTSPGGLWTTIRSMQGTWFCDQATPDGLPAWPVLDASGELAFSSSRYPTWVRGADFTPVGDTLWVVGATPTWSLDAWKPSTGELLREMPLQGFSQCDDVLVDPVRPYVYVACRRALEDTPGTTVWPSLVVVDRSSGESVAVLDPHALTEPWPFLPPVALVFGGSSGRVHATGVWDGTSAPVDRGVFVSTWDILPPP